MVKSPKLRAIGVVLGFALMVIAFAASITIAPTEAEAGCRSTSVCSYRYGRQVCTSSSVCSAPRIRSCSYVNRCHPQRTCHSSYGRTTCVTRDVCRREQVCN